MKITPIFLISLPRSGSTMLQRILSTHSEIATAAEPWIMLPLVYGFARPGRIITEYYQHVCDRATADYISTLPNQAQDYYDAARSFAEVMYSRATTSKQSCFLDKTPRYHLIIPELAKIFPDAKFILLYRNLLDVFASSITFQRKYPLMSLGSQHIDLIDGVANMAKARDILGDRALCINYESIVTSPQTEAKRLFQFLGLDEPNNWLDSFSSSTTTGSMGDKQGLELYQKPDSNSVEKWKQTLSTSFRLKLASDWIKNLDSANVSAFGTPKSELLDELGAQSRPWRPCVKERIYYYLGQSYTKFRVNMWFPLSGLYQRTKGIVLR